MKNLTDYNEKMKKIKIVQLIIIAIIDLAFFIILFINENLRDYVFSNPAVLILFVFMLAMLVFGIVFLIIDFNMLRTIDKESHDLSRLAYLDSLTGIPNRYSLDLIFNKYNTPESVSQISCILMGISNLSEINETLDRKTGDKIMRDFSHILEVIGDKYGFIGRNGGNEFICVIDKSTKDKHNNFLSEIEKSINNYNNEHDTTPIIIELSSIYNPDTKFNSLNEIISQVYSDFCSKAR